MDEVKKAQLDVEMSIAHFESAITSLATSVDDTRERVEHVIDVAKKPFQMIDNLNTHLKDVSPFALYPGAAVIGFLAGRLWASDN